MSATINSKTKEVEINVQELKSSGFCRASRLDVELNLEHPLKCGLGNPTPFLKLQYPPLIYIWQVPIFDEHNA